MNKEKILVVDDDPDLLWVVGHRLKSKGFKVITAPDGETAVKKAEKKMPDLIILDMIMPGLSGYEVAKLLKENDKTKDIPIIILTGKAKEVSDRVKGLEVGAFYYITKPYEPVDFLNKVKEALERVKR